jgi:PAS domain S-box-containing protein
MNPLPPLGTQLGTTSWDVVRATEEHLRLALEAGEIGTWEWDLVSERMRWSARMFCNLGLPVEVGANVITGWASDLHDRLLAVTHPDDRRRVAAALAQFSGRAGPLRLEFRIVPPGGDVQWIVFLGNVVADSTGRPTRMLGISIDSTRRRRAVEATEAALRESERRLRELNERLEQLAEERAHLLDASRAQIQAIFDIYPDWLVLFRATADGRFVYEDLNHATERGYGLSRDQVVGRPLEDILGVEQAQLPLHHMRECIRTGENQRYSARRTLAGVTRTIDVMFVRVPEKIAGDWLILSTARDLTEREEMEQQLRQAQKMEAVGHLTGGIAHDFNNLLTAVLGNLELLAPSTGSDPAAARYVRAAQRAAENGAKLTEQLLAFSRRQHLQPRAVDLNAIIGGMREMLIRTIGRSVQVCTEFTPDLWPALVDPTQIETAILNLAINARDAMPEGGRLTIETRNLPAGADAAPSEIGGQDCISITVRDTGTGMTEEVLRSAVEPFFTTKEPGKGSGLGLSQVYGMVKQSNGALRIESQLGAGTAVHLYLPRAIANKAAPEMPTDANRTDELGGRVLVVDDDPGVREITTQLLREAGFSVAEAESGNAALNALMRGETYDLLVVDIAMPDLSGIDTIRRARERWPGLRALYVTGFADAVGAQLQTGGEPVLQKPFRLTDLSKAVSDAMKRTR